MVYPVARYTLLHLINLFIRRTEGVGHIPITGSAILACQHWGPLDALFIAAAVVPKINRKIHFIANIKPWGWFWAEIVAKRWAGCIPFDKHNRQLCLEIARQHLEQGKIVGIFPSGVLHEQRETNDFRGKTGVARLALWTRTPVIPVGIQNFSTLSIVSMVRKHLMKPRSMEIRIGEPLTFPEAYDKPLSYELLREVTNTIVARMHTLSKVID